ncbi:MAG: hypothetical protein JW797_04205, partial [Bradymonadales bacterium]|nr:hypothetical protein [Bradymonadales bacterium]
WWPVEFGGPAYTCRTTNISDNTITGTSSTNEFSSAGDANLRLVGPGGTEFIVVGNEFVDIDSPNGCGILLKAVTNRATVVNNSFVNLSLGTCEKLLMQTGAVLTGSRQGVGTRKCTIANNDYTESGLTGLDPDIGLSPPFGVPFVTLNEDSEDNLVNEFEYPEDVIGTGIITVLDLGTNNTVIVY